MWRFRVHRPLLLTMIVVDILVMISFWILGSVGVHVNGWTNILISIVVGSNLAALWRDGVN